MKKLFLIISTILISFYSVVYSQTVVGKTVAISSTNTGGGAVARDYIDLLPGFDFSTTGTTFDALIDESLVYDVDYSSTQPGTGRELSTSLPVGSLPGSFNVTPTGAATYTIPIDIPPGTAGMQPSLAITYSSQAGNGLLGMGFNLSGLSAISRTGSTIYNDGNTRGVNLDNNDNFAIDGNRLVSVSGSNGSQQYHTETETYNIIQAYDNNSDGTPDYFKVFTKDGKFIEYGNRTGSKFLIGSVPVTWFITKVSDAFGNYMEYYYNTHTTGEVYLDYILYTGTTGFSPYCKVSFFYETRTVDKTTSYVKGNLVTQSLLLRKISTYSEGEATKQYCFKYHCNTIGKDVFTYLSEVQLKNDAGTYCNSTVFNWNKNNTVWTLNEIPALIYDHPQVQDANKNTKHLYSCDVNGDGISDVFKIFKYGSYFYGEKFESQVSSATGGNPTFIHTINGNYSDPMGLDIVQNNISNKNGGLLFADFNGSGIKNTYYMEVANFLEIKELQFRKFENAFGFFSYKYDPEVYIPLYQVSDIKNNGKDYVLIANDDNDSEGGIKLKYKNINESDIDITISSFVEELDGGLFREDKLRYILQLDLNNDGLPDLFAMSKNQYKIYYNRGEQNTEQPFYNYNPDITGQEINYNYYNRYENYAFSRVYPGDYNGDGLIDLLCYVVYKDNTYNFNYKWVLATNKQNSFVFTTLSCFTGIYDDIDTDKDDERDNCFVTDINKDGKQDIVNYNARYGWSGNNKVFVDIQKKIFLSTGADFEQYGSTETITDETSGYAYLKTTGDFNGDGSADLLYYNNADSKYYCNYSFNTQGQHMVSDILDGMNNKTTVGYNRITKGGTLYSKTTTAVSYPYARVTMPITVVDNVTAPNGNYSTYSYKDATAHLNGKGFLGFREFKATDVTNNASSVTSFYHSLGDYCVALPEKTNSYVGSTEISEVKNTYSIINMGTKKRMYPLLQNSEQTDKLRNFKTTTVNVFESSHGNIKSDSTQYFEGTSKIGSVKNAYNSYADRITISGDLNTYKNKPGSISTTTRNYRDDGGVAFSRRTDFAYNSNGSVSFMVTNPGLAKKCSTAYEYNSNGTLKKQTLSSPGITNSRFTSYLYDGKYRFITKETDALGFFTESTYDNKTGNILTATDINKNVETYTYNAFDRLKEIISATGVKIRTEKAWYNSPDRTDAVYKISSYTNEQYQGGVIYDKLGREIISENINVEGKKVCTEKIYNSKGQLYQVSQPYFDGDGKTFYSYSYDGYGRLEKEYLKSVLITRYYYTLDDNRTVKVVNERDNKWSSKQNDAMGNMIVASDDGGSVTYKYFSSGNIKCIAAPGSTVSMTYDEYGRQKTLTDPDAGTTSYEYNAFGEIISQTDYRGNNFTMAYDQLGRIISKTWPDSKQTSYEYYTSGNGKGLLKKVTAPNTMYDSYVYDKYGQVTSKTSYVESGVSLTTSYQYDNMGRMTVMTYPYGFAVKNVYNVRGNLTEVRRNDNNNLIWKAVSENPAGQWTGYTLGNNLISRTFQYDSENYPQQITSEKISNGSKLQDLKYSFSHNTGNMSWRKDLEHTVNSLPLLEVFEYDNLNRLTGYTVNSGTKWSMVYDNAKTGNMTKKDLVGDYEYQASRPHAISKINNAAYNVPSGSQLVNYNEFNKIKDITEGSNNAVFSYGPGEGRRKMVYTNGTTTTTTYYDGLFELEDKAGTEKYSCYIMGGDGVAAIYQYGEVTPQMYYVLTDYQGTYNALANEAGNKVVEMSFDPWGRRRNPANWGYDGVTVPTIITRGYTGHEHLDNFSLINMNGRVYDPWLGRFLSPDNYVSFPEHTQSYNRYSYCLNNPMKFTDPSGNNPLLLFMLYGAMQGGMVSWYNTGDFLGGFARGAIIGGVSAGVGYGMGYLAQSLNIAGIIPGSAWGVFSGAIGGGLTGGITSISTGGDFWDGAMQGAIIGGIIGGIQGGIEGYKLSQKYGWNNWTGGMNDYQKELWKSYNAGTLIDPEGFLSPEECLVAFNHPDEYIAAGSPHLDIKDLYVTKSLPDGSVEKIMTRGSTYPINKLGNDLRLLDASKIEGGVKSRIELHNGLSGKQFLKTSYHELAHAKMYYNGDMYRKYVSLSGLSSARQQYGILLYGDSWAYDLQRQRYGGLHYNSKYNQVTGYWKNWNNNDFSWVKNINR